MRAKNYDHSASFLPIAKVRGLPDDFWGDDERKTKAIFALIDMTVKAVRKRRKEAMQRSTVQEDANKKMDEAIAAIEEE